MASNAGRTPGNALTFAVRVTPNASKSEFAGRIGDAAKVKLKAKPVDGAANKELVRFLAGFLKVSKSSISLVRGVRSRDKLVSIECRDKETKRSIEEVLKELF